MISILLVEDSAEMANIIQKFLKLCVGVIGPITVVWTESGRAARNLVLDTPEKFDLIITDNQLGEERNFWGKEIVREIRHRGPNKIKIILMSSEFVEQYEDGQADVFILKNSKLMGSIINQVKEWFK